MIEILLFAGLIIIFCVLFNAIFSDDSHLLSDDEKDEIVNHLAKGNIAHLFETILIRKKNEKLIFSLQSVDYYEGWVTTHRGGIKKRSDLHKLDTGELSVTSKRLVFIGLSRSPEYQLGEINSVRGDGDTVAISPSRKNRNVLFVGVNSAIYPPPDKRDNRDSKNLRFRFEGEHLAEAIKKNVAGLA